VHPLGIMPVWVSVDSTSEDEMVSAQESDSPKFKVLAFVRTSRRIMDGQVYLPADVWDGQERKGK